MHGKLWIQAQLLNMIVMNLYSKLTFSSVREGTFVIQFGVDDYLCDNLNGRSAYHHWS